MTKPPSGRAFRARVIVDDDQRRHGYTPPGHGPGRPMIVWRRAGCRCRVLRLYLTPEGWELIGDDYRVKPDEWLRMVGAVDDDGHPVTLDDGGKVTLDDRDAGNVVLIGLREVDGMTDTLPLDIDAWPTGVRMQLGCDHGHGTAPVADLAADARTVRHTRQPLETRRSVVLDGE
ncbi:MAG TPA: hypothetical protein VKY79_05100 [Actinomycetaceae bacterium]|nr:hypothetical protein [Actinomycetaceae bacterium]